MTSCEIYRLKSFTEMCLKAVRTEELEGLIEAMMAPGCSGCNPAITECATLRRASA